MTLFSPRVTSWFPDVARALHIRNLVASAKGETISGREDFEDLRGVIKQARAPRLRVYNIYMYTYSYMCLYEREACARFRAIARICIYVYTCYAI